MPNPFGIPLHIHTLTRRVSEGERIMMKWILTLLLLGFVGCGKNEAVRPVGNYPNQGPINQAPPPPVNNGGGYYPYNQPPMQEPPPYFNPNMPPQMPPQFYPWLPVYNYFQSQPVTINVWVNIWSGWQNYSRQNGCDMYDFKRFWYDYCPQYLPQQYQPTYQYFDQNYYYWMNQNTQFAPNCDASYFWANYSYDDCESCYY